MPKPNTMDDLDKQIDDLIMRLKDCISHEDKPDQHFSDRCITKVQFKQHMKALITAKMQEVDRAGREQLRKSIRDSLLQGAKSKSGDVVFVALSKDLYIELAGEKSWEELKASLKGGDDENT